jgi:hypothetical protein
VSFPTANALQVRGRQNLNCLRQHPPLTPSVLGIHRGYIGEQQKKYFIFTRKICLSPWPTHCSERAAQLDLPAAAPALDTTNIGNISWIHWSAATEISYYHQENLPFSMANALQVRGWQNLNCLRQHRPLPHMSNVDISWINWRAATEITYYSITRAGVSHSA